MPELQDTILFELTEEGAVTNKTIKVTAVLAGHLTDGSDELLWANIRDTLGRFIPRVDWQYSDTQRHADPAGGERINITATTRCPVAENRALDQRSRDAGRVGLMISHFNVDNTPPLEDIRKTERRLRLAVLKLAEDEAEAASEQTGRNFRVGTVNFVRTHSMSASNQPRMAMSAMAQSQSMRGDDAAGGSAQSEGNTIKLAVTAQVELRTGANAKKK